MLMVEGSREVGLDAVISYGRGMKKNEHTPTNRDEVHGFLTSGEGVPTSEIPTQNSLYVLD